MTTITIDNRSYPCPSAWNEIGWEQFFTLAEYAGQTVGTSATERKAERVLERICGVDPGTVRKIDGRQRKQFADCLGERFSGFRRHFRRIRTETTVRTVSIGTEYGCCFPLRQSIPTAASYR